MNRNYLNKYIFIKNCFIQIKKINSYNITLKNFKSKMASKTASSICGTWILEKNENFDEFLKELDSKYIKLNTKTILFYYYFLLIKA